MNRLSLLFLLLPSLLFAQHNIAPTDALKPEDERKTFKVPEGFEVQLVAAEPDIMKPMQMCFDARGRLWVTTSQEYPFPAAGRPGQDKLFVLEDFDTSGKAKKITTFADDLNIPIGVLPLPNGKEVIVQSAPNIWKLTDTDGDGKADKKEVLYGPFGVRDTHGMVNSFTLGPDGWVYATHGYLNSSKVKGKDGHEVEMQSGHTFRFRPDGSRIEVWTRGQVNPFGMCFDPWGNLYTADCHSKPITQLIRGAHYDSFGKPHDGLGYGPNMLNHDHGSTALCGLTWYEANQFPKEYRGTMFLGNVVTNRINFDRIEFVGSTPRAVQQPDFLTSTDEWFRPVDLKMGMDGALYVADFYNRIIGHYEVDLKHPGRDKLRGRIWRIVWKGKNEAGQLAPVVNLQEAPGSKLFELVSDPNLTTRQLATNQIIWRGEKLNRTHDAKFVAPTEPQALAEAWGAAMQAKGEEAIPSLEVKSPEGIVQYLRLIGSSPPERVAAQGEFVLKQLKSDHPQVLRAALQTVTLQPKLVGYQATLELLPKIPASDSHLRHAARVALRDQLKVATDWSKMSELTEAQVRLIGDVCPAVPAKEAADFLLATLPTQEPGRRPQYVEHIARHGDAKSAEVVVEFIVQQKPQAAGSVAPLYAALAKGLQQKGAKLPDAAVPLIEDMCVQCLQDNDLDTIQTGIDLAAGLKLTKLFDPLAQLVRNKDREENRRASAVSALVALDANKSIPLLSERLVDGEESMAVRERIVNALAAVNQPAAREVLLKGLESVPTRLANTIAFGLALTREGGEKLLTAVEQGKTSARVLQQKQVQDRLNNSKIPDAANRVANLTKGLPNNEFQTAKLLAGRRSGFFRDDFDPKLGKEVFAKNCANCHQLGGQGAKVGPQLDGIGNRGLDRLLEDILDPSRNVDQAFRATRVVKQDGGVVEGLVLREEGKILILADHLGKEIRVEGDNVESKKQLLTSPMPANLVETIPERDFYNLMTYLLQQREERGKK
jgi:putative heme-binding domain-containing protein